MLQDDFGRTVSYLRVSVTDRCDFRCSYCLPREFRGFETPANWLSPAELERVVRAFAALGVRHVRLTGGEPTVRRELPEIARRLAAVPGIEDLSLSTNAGRLAQLAGPLRQAGIGRVNVSLDSLDPDSFRRLTNGRLERVLEGLEAARTAGFAPIKVNMVVMRGVNDHEIEAIAEYCMARGFSLRFIETMPVGEGGRGAQERYVDLGEIKQRLAQRYGLEPAAMQGSGPARYYRVGGSGLIVGFITPLSQHFCATCNRVRLAVDGSLYLCLGQEHKVELRPWLRAGIGLEELQQRLREAIRRKPERHEFTTRPEHVLRPMSALGG